MKLILRLILLVGFLCVGLSVSAQQPVLNYTLAINPADTSSVQITMRVRNLPKVFHVAMVSHFLVDDAYWRGALSKTCKSRKGQSSGNRMDCGG